jgi:hypothetical protein
MRRAKKKKKKIVFGLPFACLLACLTRPPYLHLNSHTRTKITLQRERENICNEREREGQEGSSVDFLISQAPIKSASLGKNE